MLYCAAKRITINLPFRFCDVRTFCDVQRSRVKKRHKFSEEVSADALYSGEGAGPHAANGAGAALQSERSDIPPAGKRRRVGHLCLGGREEVFAEPGIRSQVFHLMEANGGAFIVISIQQGRKL